MKPQYLLTVWYGNLTAHIYLSSVNAVIPTELTFGLQTINCRLRYVMIILSLCTSKSNNKCQFSQKLFAVLGK